MNFQEIQAKIAEIGVEKFSYSEKEEGLPEFKIVHEEGDTEGGGEYSEKVFHFPEDDIYVRITGFYSSYEGTEWNEGVDNIVQVFPRTVEVIQYHPTTG